MENHVGNNVPLFPWNLPVLLLEWFGTHKSTALPTAQLPRLSVHETLSNSATTYPSNLLFLCYESTSRERLAQNFTKFKEKVVRIGIATCGKNCVSTAHCTRSCDPACNLGLRTVTKKQCRSSSVSSVPRRHKNLAANVDPCRGGAVGMQEGGRLSEHRHCWTFRWSQMTRILPCMCSNVELDDLQDQMQKLMRCRGWKLIISSSNFLRVV
jgi:hypothetical protein